MEALMFKYTKNKLLKHSILVMSYGRDPVIKKEVRIIQNSWGEYWGSSGFAKVARVDENGNNVLIHACSPMF